MIFVLFGCPLAGAAEDSPLPDLSDGRAGRIYFESLTPTGYFQLARHQVPQRTMIFGTLRLPPTSARQVPAMVIAHGSDGVTDTRDFWWADNFLSMGVAAFVVDSFTPRNVHETATNQRQLTGAANVADALSSLRLLATHPRIDSRRIGIIGFSRGGRASLYTSFDAYRTAVVSDDTRFALHVALYPYCNGRQITEHLTKAPILFLLGGRDDWTPPEACQDYARWFQSKGVEAGVITYPDAFHGFDSPEPPVFISSLANYKNCDTTTDIDALKVWSHPGKEDVTKIVVPYLRRCTGRGGTVGGDPAARRQATDDVKGFLKRVFKL